MRSLLGIFLRVGAMLWLSYFFMKKNDVDKKETKIFPVSSSPILEEVIPEVMAKTEANNTGAINIFATTEQTNATIQKIDEIGRYIRASDKEAAFAESHLDTDENYQASLRNLQKAYSVPSKREVIAQRVLAIKFLSLSQYLEITDCLKLLREMSEQMRNGENDKLNRVLSIDLYETAQTCAKLSPDETQELARDLDVQRAKKSVHLALNYVKEGLKP